ncbi:MAG: hypothetical protein ABSG68_25095 [Thermoguttaceae bacterium]
MIQHAFGPQQAPPMRAGPATHRKWLLSVREDTRRRLAEVKSFKFADGPLPTKIWCVAGFRGKDRFYTDPAINEGVVAEWYLPALDDKDWGTKDTFHCWDAKDKPEDSKGHDYDGYGWYRLTVDVPAGCGRTSALMASGDTHGPARWD